MSYNGPLSLDTVEFSHFSKILILSHKDPDLDAITSSLFVYNILTTQFPNKEIMLNIHTQELPSRFSFLPNFDKFSLEPTFELIKRVTPDLIIFTDGGELHMFIEDSEIPEYQKFIAQNNISTICFDHHTDHINEHFEYNFVTSRSSTVEILYRYFSKQTPELFHGWEEIVLIGIISDTERFYYDSPSYTETLEVVSSIVKRGFSVRKYDDLINTYSVCELRFMSDLFSNIAYEKDFVYTFVSKESLLEYEHQGLTGQQKRMIMRKVIDNYLNHIAGYNLCVAFIPHTHGEHFYRISIRSKPGTFDCTKILKNFNGGGYVTGGGASVDAKTLEEAVVLINVEIGNYLSS